MLGPEQKFGLRMEEWTLHQLQQLGHPARLVSDFFEDVDIFIGPLAIEVKAARATWQRAGRKRIWRQRWQFDTARIPRDVDSVLVLVAIDDNDQPHPFIIPSWLAFGRRNIQITSHPERYAGRLATCLNNWSNVDLVLSRRQEQVGQYQLPLLSISREMVTL